MLTPRAMAARDLSPASGEADAPGEPPVRASWAAVVPVKRLARAKSRLAERAGDHRERLALALATDTVSAALACPRVHGLTVVTDDPVAAPVLAELGARIVPDEPDAGLNPALRHGAATAATVPGARVAALSADLPSLRSYELARALDAAAGHASAFVPDAAGTGTTVYASRSGAAFAPEFGNGSRQRHVVSGVTELAVDGIESVRLDVDTPEDLQRALRLGVGARTAEVVAAL